MFQVLYFLGFVLLANSQTLLFGPGNNDDRSAPTPYEFSYTAPAIGGGSSHQESGDEFGRKTGSYTVEDDDGRQRIVQYVADENGFRASISTNEPGTSNQNPADVTIASSADNGVQELTAPIAPLVPIAPARTSPPAPRQFIRPSPIPFRRPIQQPFIPIQPTLLPFQPTFIPSGNNQPSVFPIGIFGGNSFVSGIPGGQPTLIPIGDGLRQPTLFPIPDNFFQFRPYGGSEAVLQPF